MNSIFITGAGSGIGRATAHLFATRDWFVGAYDIDARGLAETMQTLDPTRSMSGVFDVCDATAWRDATVAFGARTQGAMHVLVNNAGIAHTGRFEDISPMESARIVDVNLKGAINGIYACLPMLRETNPAHILNIASASALYGTPTLAVYSATKFALRGLSEALALEFAPYGIAVSSLAPWFIDTPLVQGAVDLKRNIKTAGAPIYPVRDVAEAIWRAAHQGSKTHLVGAKASELAFAARFLPGMVRAQMRKMMLKGA